MNIFRAIEEKQKLYYKLQKELQILIGEADGTTVRYKNKRGILKRIYTDSTADVIFEDENGEQYEQMVKLSDLY
ncbi:hypothetical protein [Metasolibacillus sp.]|uniref:hypothetical protein n=1 Tax=Metasolibacillus sp. TaxID=2703680 RepID=UPI0025E7A3D2|nr:hypothetical protein [Metasolibacillus sp.]MCT6925388.1 hypothetical protein [Metasolibacillus sp.]MCT6941584.1 hypothetical protein [Metasolibacillus sp.]